MCGRGPTGHSAACAEQVRIDHVLDPHYATPLLGPRPLYHFYFAWRAQIGVLLPQSRPLKSEAFPPSDQPYMYGTDCESSKRIITAQRMKITIMRLSMLCPTPLPPVRAIVGQGGDLINLHINCPNIRDIPNNQIPLQKVGDYWGFDTRSVTVQYTETVAVLKVSSEVSNARL